MGEVKQKYEVSNGKNIDENLEYFRGMGDCLVYSVDVLQAYKTPLNQIISLYVTNFHEKLMLNLKAFWKSNSTEITSMEILELLTWLHDYYKKLSSFGVEDSRVPIGIKTLSTIFSKRLLKNSVDLIFNLIEHEKTSEIEIDSESGLPITSAPRDLFKILSEIIALLKINKQKELGLKIMETCMRIIQVFKSEYISLMESGEFETVRLFTTCNNIMLYITQAKNFKGLAFEMLQGDIKEAELDAELPTSKMIQVFNKIGTEAYLLINQALFGDIEKCFDKFFTLVSMEKVLEEVWNKNGENVKKLEAIYQKRLVKFLAEKVVFLYMQKAIVDSDKLQPQIVRKIRGLDPKGNMWLVWDLGRCRM